MVAERARQTTIGMAIAMALLCVSACDSTIVTVRGEAMSPTFKDGDTAIGLKAVDPISRGDIVGFRYPRDESKSFVQRIVGLPGEEIEIANGQVTINGKPIEEPYVLAANNPSFFLSRRRIADGEYFMMGDNRVNSSDSRSWGTVARPLIWIKLATK